MKARTFVALSGTYGILFLLTAAWTARQVAIHGTENVSAPVFPAMALGALIGVVVMKVGGDRRGQPTPATALAGVVSFAAVTAAGLLAWFLTAG